MKRDYDRIRAINFSTLKHMNRSPKHYRYMLDNPVPVTDAMAMGSAVHIAVLEPDLFPKRCVLWDGGTRRGKDWESFKDMHAGKMILKQDEYDTCLRIRDAARTHPRAAELLTGKGVNELTMTWDDAETGLGCKGRIDRYTGDRLLIDLKTTRDLIGWRNQSARMLYHVQVAMYHDGLVACKRKVAEVKFVVVEQQPPHDVIVYDVLPSVIASARAKYRSWLYRLQECLVADTWPGVCDYEIPHELPEWAGGDNDISGLDIDF